MFYEREASSWRFQRPGLGPRFFRPARGGGGREVHSTCGSGVPRRFPAVARRRFYWPSPSGRPLNVDPWVWADSKASAPPRATGKEADTQNKFLVSRSPAARFFAPMTRRRADSDQERVSTRRRGLTGPYSLAQVRLSSWRKPVLLAFRPSIRPSLGAVWAAEAQMRDRKMYRIFAKTRAIIAKTCWLDAGAASSREAVQHGSSARP